MPSVRIVGGTLLALVALALYGCPDQWGHWGCTDRNAERGEAGVRVPVVEETGKPLGVSAEIVDWNLEVHPQVPDRGQGVRFRYRFEAADPTSGPAVDACAVDVGRVALGRVTCHSSQAFGPGGPLSGDEWFAVQHPEHVAGVLPIPDDQS
ncbi:hypothetical protein [Streptomyces parvulus]|uniref:hypothetical protein n=1 Tax=Streptomyces parvulus TaxID=146923 RepID=UPI0036983C4C